MVATAYVLISVKAGTARQVYTELQKLPHVQSADAVAGPYDIIATVQGSDFNEIGAVVIDRVQRIKGVTDSITCNVIRFEQ